MSQSFKLCLSIPPLLWMFSRRWLCVIKKPASEVDRTITAAVCRRAVLPRFPLETVPQPYPVPSAAHMRLPPWLCTGVIMKARAQFYLSLNLVFFLQQKRRSSPETSGCGMKKTGMAGDAILFGNKFWAVNSRLFSGQ